MSLAVENQGGDCHGARYRYDCYMPFQMRSRFRYLMAAVLLLPALLLSGCVSVPEEPEKPAQPSMSREEVAEIAFERARALYQAGDYVSAGELMKTLAEQGHLQAQYVLGYMYHYGLGMPRNEKEAIRWITAAAARGYPLAQEALKDLGLAPRSVEEPAE